MEAIVIAATTLIILHSVSGYIITINPQLVTSMREGEGKGTFTDGARCLINMSDGKFVTVAETCEQVRELVSKSRQP